MLNNSGTDGGAGPQYEFLPNADTAVTVQFKREISKEVNRYVTALADIIAGGGIDGIIETVPTFTSLTVFYDCSVIRAAELREKLAEIIKTMSSGESGSAKVYHIPVCYDEKFALDMNNVCEHTGLTAEEIIKIHTSSPYLIYMLGFLPGFAYLGGLDERIATPRLKSPRLEIFEGAVGIGGNQTGIYPIASPGGWQLIGKTPVKVFDLKREKPILYEAGDYIEFYPVTLEEYNEIEKQIENGGYEVKVTEVRDA